MPSACTVLIAAGDLLPSLESRINSDGGELLTFTDADALGALEVITQRKPATVAVEQLFAATPRGAALIKRIKADAALRGCEIREVSPAGSSRILRKRSVEPADDPGAGAAAVAAVAAAALDVTGTRRAPRFKVDELVEVLVDGNLASVVDLSTEGAQVLSPTVLKPNQRVRVALSDEQGVLRFNAAIAWASFEIPSTGGPRYRAGIQFIDASSQAVGEYALRHRVP